MPLHVSGAFPSDEVGAGFDNNGDVLSIPPMLFEKYMDAAEEISQRVIYDPSQFDRFSGERSGDQLIAEGDSWVGSFYGQYLARDAFLWTEVDVPYEGRYDVRVRGGAGQPDAKVRIGLFDSTGLLQGICAFEFKGDRGTSDSDSLELTLPAGKQRLILAPLADDAEATIGESRWQAIARLDEATIKAGRERVGKKL